MSLVYQFILISLLCFESASGMFNSLYLLVCPEHTLWKVNTKRFQFLIYHLIYKNKFSVPISPKKNYSTSINNLIF